MREELERALGPYRSKRVFDAMGKLMVLPLDINALAESKDVIVIEGQLKHHETSEGKWTNFYYGEGGRLVATIASGKHIGTPGPYLIIGVPKPKEKEDE